MTKVKARKIGKSMALTVPQEIDIVAKNYHVYQSTDGMILYVPENIPNPFEKIEPEDILKHCAKKPKE